MGSQGRKTREDRKPIGTCTYCGAPAYRRTDRWTGKLEPYCTACYMQVHRTGSPIRTNRKLTQTELNACVRLRKRNPKKWTYRALAERLRQRGITISESVLHNRMTSKPYKDYPFQD